MTFTSDSMARALGGNLRLDLADEAACRAYLMSEQGGNHIGVDRLDYFTMAIIRLRAIEYRLRTDRMLRRLGGVYP